MVSTLLYSARQGAGSTERTHGDSFGLDFYAEGSMHVGAFQVFFGPLKLPGSDPGSSRCKRWNGPRFDNGVIAMTKSQKNPQKSSSRGRKPPRRFIPRSSNASSSATKTAILLGLLSKRAGATIETMASAAGWQTHSVRGFLAGHVRKKLGLNLASEKDTEGVRLYRIIQG